MANGTIMMAVTEALNIPIGSLTMLIQALGGIIILYLAFSVANFIINWKKNKEIKKMGRDIQQIKSLLSKRRKKK